MKTRKEKEYAVGLLNRLIKQIEHGDIHWIAVSTKYHSGETLAVHTKGAPKRPKGLA